MLEDTLLGTNKRWSSNVEVVGFGGGWGFQSLDFFDSEMWGFSMIEFDEDFLQMRGDVKPPQVLVWYEASCI